MTVSTKWRKTGRWSAWLAVLALAALLAAFAVACSGVASSAASGSGSAEADPVARGASAAPANVGPLSSPAGVVTASSIGTDDSLLRVKFKGLDSKSVPFRNGGVVEFPGELRAEVFVDPYPTDTLTSWVDLYLTKGPLDEPVDDAHVAILYDMWSMSHGPYTGLADSAADGHYTFRLDYIMFGAWEQVFEIREKGSDQVHEVVLVIVALP